MNEECLICGAKLVYLSEAREMECGICRKKEMSRTICENGHYVCNECHMGGMDAVFGVCLTEKSRNPIEIMEKLMSLEFCHMHGPEHHVMTAMALITAYKNAGGELDLHYALREAYARGKEVPGGACGFWGACGAGISSGIFVSVISGADPLSGEAYGLANSMTAKSLAAIGKVGGPRCCKRNAYLAILSAAAFVREHFVVPIETNPPKCTRSAMNNQCIKGKCPFYRG